ncbi:MAG: hypothetical protein H5T63_06145 [Chloroflexi bacterium]|nr:hypothetical protein [Chloroflexota bacterium]
MAKGNELKQRATRAIVAHAFFRLESALTIAMTMILIALFPKPFPWWQWWYWLVLGVFGEALIVYTSITDEMTMRKVVADMLRQEFNPREIRTREYRQRVEKALEYRQRIEEHVRSATSGVLRDHLLDTTAGIAEWVANVFGLAKRLDSYQNDEILHQDRRDLPREIAELQARLQREDDEAVRQELRQAIAGKQEQLTNLEKLQNMMEKAEYQLETTLTALGTVYSQLLLIGSKDIDSGRAQRLRESIADQVAALQALQETLDEVYGTSAVR